MSADTHGWSSLRGSTSARWGYTAETLSQKDESQGSTTASDLLVQGHLVRAANWRTFLHCFSLDAVKQHSACCFSPQVVLVVSQTRRQQRVGAQLHKTLVKLLGHKVESVEKHEAVLLQSRRHLGSYSRKDTS